ncbi:hypothetical protein WJX77_005595 [Trebouxia sp. C0004]
MQTRRGKRKHEQVGKRCSKLPAKLQEYIMPDRKPRKAPSAKQQVAAPRSVIQPRGAKMLLFNKPCCATSIRKLTIKLGSNALASHQASIALPELKQSQRLKLKSPLTRPATHTAEPSASLPLAQSQKQTLPHAKRFKPAPVERPVTRHFKRQQTTKLKVHLRLRTPAQSAVTQRKSTLTHQQKRHGADIIRSTGQAEQRLQSQDADLLTTCTQSLPGGAAAAVHQSDMGDASAAGQAAGLAGAPEAGHSNVNPAPMLSTMTTSIVAAAAAATAADRSGNTAAAEAAAAAEANTAHCPAQVALLKKATGVVVLPLWSSHHRRAGGSLNGTGTGTHRGLKRQATASSVSQPPYKLVAAKTALVTLPVVLYSSPCVAAGQHNAKRRRMGPSSAAFHTPWSLLTSRGSPFPVQSLLTARSLWGEAIPVGSRGSLSGTTRRIGNRQQMVSYTERVAHWQREQRELLQCLLQQQVTNFNHSKTTVETAQAGLTSSVSYVTASGSRQLGAVPSLPCLPHVVIRPPNLSPSTNATAATNLACLKSQAVLAVSMPLRDDSAVKEYLLHPNCRASLLMSHGAVASSIHGADALEPLMSGRCFVCLHYKLAPGARLEPCLPLSNAIDQDNRDALQESTVQVGLQIRKGVGGTCPARAAARRPAMQSLLAALLTPAPLQHSTPATIPTEAAPITAKSFLPQPQKQRQQLLQQHQQPKQQTPMCESAPTALWTSPLLHPSPAQLLSSGHVAGNDGDTSSAAWPEDNAAAGAEKCEEEEDQSLQAGEQLTACMAEGDQTACMDQQDEPAWLEEQDQTGMGERGEGSKVEEEGQSAMAEQSQTALVNKGRSHGQGMGKTKGKCQEGTLDKEQDGQRGGDKPMEEEDKEVEDEPEELVDGRTPFSPRPNSDAFEGITLPEQDAGQLKMYTLSTRLEMYVDQAVWHKLARSERDVLYSSIKALEQHLQHKMAQWNHTNLLNYSQRLLAAVSNTQRHTAAVAAVAAAAAAPRGTCPSVAYATAPDAAAVVAPNGGPMKAAAASAAPASPVTGTPAVNTADIDSADVGTAMVATTTIGSPATSEQSPAAASACSAAEAAVPWTPARPTCLPSSSLQSPPPTTSPPTTPPPTDVLPQLSLPCVTAMTAPQPAPESRDALPLLPPLAPALSQGCVAEPPCLAVPLPTAAVPLLPLLPLALDQSQSQPPSCQSSPQTSLPLLLRSQSPSQPMPLPSAPLRMHQPPSMLPPPPPSPPPTLRERPCLSPPAAASIATPPLPPFQTRFVAVHPWEDQLTGLQASDAASQLVFAVAAASAASPRDRAQAGQFPWPYYLIGTRDSFTNELVKVQTQVCSSSRRFVKTEFFFKAGEEPDNYQQVVSAVRPAASSLSSQPTCLVPITHAVTPAPPDSFPQQHSHQQQSHSVVPEAAQSSPQLQTPSRDDKQSCPTPSMPHVSSILELPTKSGLARVIQRDSQDKASAVRIVSEAGGSFQEQGREAVADTVMTGAAEVVPQQEAKAPDTIVSEASGIGYQAGCHLASSGRGVDDSSHSQQGQLPSEQGAGGRCHQPEAVAGSPDECTDADSSARDDNRAARDSSGTDHRPAGTDSDGLCPVGITTYTEFYSSEELAAIEAGADSIHSKAEAKLLPPECFHVTAGKAGLPKRTKFFFGARYLWTREQMSSVAAARRAHGVRVDVPAPPAWMQAQVEEPLVATGLAPKGFLNSYALNMYHDGSEGIQSHYDDADRFSRPIYSVRLFSDSRLSFGTQLYGYTNGAFCVDMPRGCITVMEQGGYAASGVKHCVRPVDMSGKSAGMIMRQINADALAEAKALHLEQTCDLLQACHLSSDANVMDQKPAHSSGSPVPSRQLGVRLHAGTHTSQSGAGRQTDEAQIRRVMSAMLKQVAGDYRREQRGARLRQAEARDIERCMERMLSQVAAKERMIDHEVRLVVSNMVCALEWQLQPCPHAAARAAEESATSARETTGAGNALDSSASGRACPTTIAG